MADYKTDFERAMEYIEKLLCVPELDTSKIRLTTLDLLLEISTFQNEMFIHHEREKQ